MSPVALVLVAWGCWQAAVLVADATALPVLDRTGRGQRLYNGTFGQRSLSAAYLALTAPLLDLVPAGPYQWAAIGAYAFGLAITLSWLALLALAVGGVWLAPASLWLSLPTLGAVAGSVAWIERRKGATRPSDTWISYTTRGDSLDTLRCRLLTWALMLAHGRACLPFGRGPGEMVRDLLRWDARYRTTLIHGYAHCEPLQLMYEHGLLGACAVGLLIWRVAPHLVLGDPWSAATITGAVLACGTIVTRIAPLGVAWLVVTAVAVAGGTR